MTEHERPMTTLFPSTTTRRLGNTSALSRLAVSVLLAGLAVSLAVTATAASSQAADGSAAKPAAGAIDAKALYEAKCQACHMADGNSQVMPNMSFADGVWKHGSTLKAVQTTISTGVPGTAMIAWKEQLSPAEIAALAKFVRKFDKKLK
jgi:cytochrome c oxidase cbb3-type subunit III